MRNWRFHGGRALLICILSSIKVPRCFLFKGGSFFFEGLELVKYNTSCMLVSDECQDIVINIILKLDPKFHKSRFKVYKLFTHIFILVLLKRSIHIAQMHCN